MTFEIGRSLFHLNVETDVFFFQKLFSSQAGFYGSVNVLHWLLERGFNPNTQDGELESMPIGGSLLRIRY